MYPNYRNAWYLNSKAPMSFPPNYCTHIQKLHFCFYPLFLPRKEILSLILISKADSNQLVLDLLMSWISTIPPSVYCPEHSWYGLLLPQSEILVLFHWQHLISSTSKKASLSDQCKETEETNRMGKNIKKIRDTKGTLHAKMGTIKDRNGMGLTEAEDIRKRWQEYTEELYKNDLHDPDNHDGVITHLQPDILKCEVK